MCKIDSVNLINEIILDNNDVNIEIIQSWNMLKIAQLLKLTPTISDIVKIETKIYVWTKLYV